MSKLIPISAEIDEDLRDQIKNLAAEGDRSFSAEVRRALRWYVMAYPKERKAKVST
jgi:hypothetical protein